MFNEATDMGSAYRPPDPRKQLSARMRSSIHAKLDCARQIWRAKAEAAGEEFDEIDLTYVVETLLERAVDEELAQWGGFSSTPEALEAQLKAVRAATKRQAK